MYRIAPRGEHVLVQHPDRVDLSVLSQFEEFQGFRGRTPRTTHPDEGEFEVSAPEQTPEEQIDSAYRLPRTALAAEPLDQVKEQSPAFFEQLVLDVLRAMGYSGTHEGAASRLGQIGDEGVDGVIREDELGIDLIYAAALFEAANKLRGCVPPSKDSRRRQRVLAVRSTRHRALAECPCSASHCLRRAKSGIARSTRRQNSGVW